MLPRVAGEVANEVSGRGAHAPLSLAPRARQLPASGEHSAQLLDLAVFEIHRRFAAEDHHRDLQAAALFIDF
jgi:hypothetical protein